jgi:hypothetical protein
MSTCCPTESQQIPQVNFSPERGSQQREEPGKGVIPTTDYGEKTHKDVEQQCRPDLPADRVCAVAQEIAQLQALLDLFKEFASGNDTDPPHWRRSTADCSSKTPTRAPGPQPPPAPVPGASLRDNWHASLCF